MFHFISYLFSCIKIHDSCKNDRKDMIMWKIVHAKYGLEWVNNDENMYIVYLISKIILLGLVYIHWSEIYLWVFLSNVYNKVYAHMH